MLPNDMVDSLSVLDNPVWYALNTHHARFAIGSGLAKCYPSQVAPYFAVADHSDVAFNDLSHIVTKGQTVRLVERQMSPELDGWTTNPVHAVAQMVCDKPVEEPRSDAQIVDLSEADVPEMMSLVELTHPGPFFPRTIEMGHYIGIRHQGQLIAMAGERMYPRSYREISAICTAPEHQGKGYARLLTSRLVNENFQRGDIPFLHVAPSNTNAYRLYESLHFRKRAEMQVTILTKVAQ